MDSHCYVAKWEGFAVLREPEDLSDERHRRTIEEGGVFCSHVLLICLKTALLRLGKENICSQRSTKTLGWPCWV